MLRFLSSSPGGAELLKRSRELRDEPAWRVLEQLQRHSNRERARAAYTVCTQRRRAADKFGVLHEQLFFDDESLQMASSLPVARHRACRFVAGVPVVDLCCGAGGDLIALAERGPVVGVEHQSERAFMASLNVQTVPEPRALIVVGDAIAPPGRGPALFVDPARRAQGRRARSINDYLPSLSHLDSWRRHFEQVVIKLSPAVLEIELPAEGELEFVSWRGQCREAVLHLGNQDGPRRRASLLLPEKDGRESPAALYLHSDTDTLPPIEVATPGAYVYEPDAALVRSHLLPLLASDLDAWLLAPGVAYLSSDRGSATPWARRFRVMDCLPYSRKSLRRTLTVGGFRPTEILRRHFPIEPAQLRQRLGRFETSARPVSLLCTRLEGRPVILICEPQGE
ncbi:MAG: hypothetical protein VX733_08690 [Candidatus Latescibacterota bacterium]|nr:hypothetical protein [Candidatus Latescibacterota bacterium]